MLFTLWKPCVMFPLNFLALLPHLSFLWRCHLWYLLPLLPQLSLLWNYHLWYFYKLATYTIVGTANGSIMPLIISYALTFVFSYSFFTFKPEAPPSSTSFFFLKALLGESTTNLFSFSNVVYISSLVILTLAGGFYELSF